MRQSVAAIALICRHENGQVLWLAQWSRSWQRYHFVGGHKRPDESFRSCAIREITEELDLMEGEEFLVADQPRAHLEYTAWSIGTKEQTQYTMELFDVGLPDDTAQRKVAADPQNRWLTETEIREQSCADGRPVSETMILLLSKAKLIPNTH